MDTKSIGTHWIAFFVNGNNAIYFDSFWVEHMPKYITANVYRIQSNDSQCVDT